MNDAYCTWIFCVLAYNPNLGVMEVMDNWATRKNAESYKVVQNLITRGGLN